MQQPDGKELAAEATQAIQNLTNLINRAGEEADIQVGSITEVAPGDDALYVRFDSTDRRKLIAKITDQGTQIFET